MIKGLSRKAETGLWILTALLFLLILLFCPDRSFGQAPNAVAVSFGPVISPYTTISANAPYRVCLATATGIPCSTAGVTLYSDINLTQVLQNPAFANSQGIVNFFTTSGAYQIQLNPVPGQTYTYYSFPLGGSGPPPGGVTIQTNSVNNLSQSLLNFVNGTGILPTNPSGGIEQLNCNTTAASGSIGCSLIPLFGTGSPTATCAASNVSQEYYDLTPANANPQIWICKQTTSGSGYAWQQLPNFTFPYPGAGVPLSTGSAWSTSYQVQGTDAKLLSSGTVTSSVGSLFCTDAQGGATTAGCAIPPSLTIQHNDSSTGINQTNLDFNDTNPAAGLGFVNVTFLTDSTGRLSGEVPTTLLQMAVTPPTSGNYVLVYPTTFGGTGSCSGTGLNNVLPGHTAGLFLGSTCTVNISGFSLAGTGVNPTTVTAIYAITVAGFFPGVYSPPYAGSLNYGGLTSFGCAGGSFTTLTGSDSQSSFLTSLTGSNIGTATCASVVTSNSSIGSSATNAVLSVPFLALAVFYSGPAVAQPNFVNVAYGICYDKATNTIATCQNFPSSLNGTFYSALPSATSVPASTTATIADSTSPNSCGPGGGIYSVHCITSGGQWVLDGGSTLNSLTTTAGVCPNPNNNPTNELTDVGCSFGGNFLQPVVIQQGNTGISGSTTFTMTNAGDGVVVMYSAGNGSTPTITGGTFSPVFNAGSNAWVGYVATNIPSGSVTITAGVTTGSYGKWYEVSNLNNSSPINGTPVTTNPTTTPSSTSELLNGMTTTVVNGLLFASNFGCTTTSVQAGYGSVSSGGGGSAFATATAPGAGNYQANFNFTCGGTGSTQFALFALQGAAGGGGSGTIGGSGTTGFLPIWTATTTLGNSLADYGVTTASTFTFAAPIDVNAAGSPTEITMTYNTGHAPAGVAGSAVVAPDTSGDLDIDENNTGFARVCTATNGACAAGGSATVGSAQVVAFSTTPTFSASFNVSRIVLTGNITSFTISGSPTDGQDKTLCFEQGSGSYTVAPPASVHGFAPVGTLNGKWNCQTFQWDNTDSIWLSTNTINQ